MDARRIATRTIAALCALLLLTCCRFTAQYRSPDWWWGPDRIHVLSPSLSGGP